MEDEGGSDENQLNGRTIKVNTSKLICKIKLSKPTQTARKKNVQHTLCTYSPSLFRVVCCICSPLTPCQIDETQLTNSLR